MVNLYAPRPVAGKTDPLIVGAGLSGLIAAHAWTRATVVERASAPRESHKAVLRFRTDAVARLTGIEFRRVRVRKGIFAGSRFHAPNIRLANLYSLKVLGHAAGGDRSIWDIEAADRWVAPETFYAQLVESVGARVEWNCEVDWPREGQPHAPIVSTAPMPELLTALGSGRAEDVDGSAFRRAPITVLRCRVAGADLYQTIYFPEGDTPMYRASITGDLLIIEAADGPEVGGSDWWGAAMAYCAAAFGLRRSDIKPLGAQEQKYGKIAPIADADRKAMMFWLTQVHGIYSLGRFATWRNILLDDVVDDIAVIKRLIHASAYDSRRIQLHS